MKVIDVRPHSAFDSAATDVSALGLGPRPGQTDLQGTRECAVSAAVSLPAARPHRDVPRPINGFEVSQSCGGGWAD
jgi:hypothetical protein